MREGKGLPFGVPTGGMAGSRGIGASGLMNRMAGGTGADAGSSDGAARGTYSRLGNPNDDGDGGRRTWITEYGTCSMYIYGMGAAFS